MNKKDKEKDNRSIYEGLALITQIGITIITSIIIGLFLGRFIDGKLGTDWIFTLIFLLIGAGAGLFNIFKLAGISSRKRK